MSKKLSKKENAIQAVKFALFSASAGIIQIVSFELLNILFKNVEATTPFTKWMFESDYGVQYLIALILSILWNFTVNRKFTFKSATNVPIAMAKVFGYYCVFTPVSTYLGVLATEHFGLGEGTFDTLLVLIPTMLTNLVTEYLFDRFVVYKDSINTAVKNDKE